MRALFARLINDNKAGYEYIRKSSEDKYNERLGSDILEWMSKPDVLATEICRHLSGERGINVIVAFDNVDRRTKDSQLKIFQTGQWFMSRTRSLCIMTLRDETYETYKTEKPLDAFQKTSNFYIRPPRFVDMVHKRLELAIANYKTDPKIRKSISIEGIANISFPEDMLGTFLTSIYADLFRARRQITTILEGLARKNAREALEMFSAILTSAHLSPREFSVTAITEGRAQIKEAQLLKSLMRTNYLYFTPDHGFVKNIFTVSGMTGEKVHFIKFDILHWLIENRKRMGNARTEGYYTVRYIKDQFKPFGYSAQLVEAAIQEMLSDNMVLSERLILSKIEDNDPIRVTASGYVHAKTLAGRTEYVSAASLITPVSDQNVARTVAKLWQIGNSRTDIRSDKKREAGEVFLAYLSKYKPETGLDEASQLPRMVESALAYRGDLNLAWERKADQQSEFENKFDIA